MTIVNVIDINALGRSFAEAIKRFDAPIAELWLHEVRGVAEVWIITDPVDRDRERAVIDAMIFMHDQFEEPFLDFRVLNPASYVQGIDVRHRVPRKAVRVPIPST